MDASGGSGSSGSGGGGGMGGAVFLLGGTLDAQGSTFSGNSATGGSGAGGTVGSGYGGAVFVDAKDNGPAVVDLVGDTFSSNTASTSEPDEYDYGSPSVLVFPEPTGMTLHVPIPSGILPGGAITVSGTVYDQAGTPLPGTTVDLSTTAGSITPTVMTDITGAFTATFTAPTTPGHVNITATVPGATPVVQQTVLTVLGPKTVGFSVSPLPVSAGNAATVSGTVYDQAGNPMPWTTVDLSASAGTIAPTVTTDVHGDFTATYTAPTTPEQVSITATVPVPGAPPVAQ